MSDGTDARACTPEALRAALGQAIRRGRGELSQAELGRRVGRPQGSISMWESGTNVPSLEKLFDLEAALGLCRGALLVDAGLIEVDCLAGTATLRRGEFRHGFGE